MPTAMQLRMNFNGELSSKQVEIMSDAVIHLSGVNDLKIDRHYVKDETLASSYLKSFDGIDRGITLAANALQYQGVSPQELSNLNQIQNINKVLLADAKEKLAAIPADIKAYQQIYLEYLKEIDNLWKTNFPNLSVPNLMNACGDYGVLSNPKSILTTVTPVTDAQGEILEYMVEMEIPQPPFNDEIINEILNAKPTVPLHEQPLWYKGMSKEEKLLFDYTMRDIHEAKDVIKNFEAISSRHRTIPGVANYSKHVSARVDKNGNIHRLPDRYRSSMISSREVKDLNLTKQEKKDLRLKYAVDNLKQVITNFVTQEFNDPVMRKLYLVDGDDQQLDPAKVQARIKQLTNSPILIQTLITPRLPFKPDGALYKDKQKAMEVIREQGIDLTIEGVDYGTFKPAHLFDTNHPLNSLHHLIPSGSIFEAGPTKKNVLALVDLVPADNKIAKAAAEQLKELILNPPNVITSVLDNNGRELHLAALEEFIVMRMGGLSYGSCVSGKDRKGLETMYVQAMEEYLLKYKELPNLSDKGKKRENFVEIFANIYISKHQQMNAGQNAPGADGIKTPSQYLPDDIQKCIKLKSKKGEILKEDNRLASNNIVGKLVKKSRKLESKGELEQDWKYGTGDGVRKNVATQSPVNPIVEIKNNIHSIEDLVKCLQSISIEQKSAILSDNKLLKSVINNNGEHVAAMISVIPPEWKNEVLDNLIRNSSKKETKIILHDKNFKNSHPDLYKNLKKLENKHHPSLMHSFFTKLHSSDIKEPGVASEKKHGYFFKK